MNGRESNTSLASREDFRTYRTSTRLVSDTIADTAHLSLRLAERLLRNGTVDVSPSGGFAVRLELDEADLPAFQNAIQLRVDLGEAIDERFHPAAPHEDDRAGDAEIQRSEFASHSRWFVSGAKGGRAVFAGTDARNVMVGLWPTRESASSAADAHNAVLDRIGAGHGLSAVGQAIRAHALEVAYDEGLFAAQGPAILQRADIDASDRRERSAFARVMREPCRSLDDIRSKVDYVLNGSVNGRPLDLPSFAGLDGLDAIDLDLLLRSLVAPVAVAADAPDEAPKQPQPPEPIETFTTLGAEAGPVLLRAALCRMRADDFAEAANGRTFRMSRLVVAALDAEPGSFQDIARFVRTRDASATDEEIEDAALRTLGTAR